MNSIPRLVTGGPIEQKSACLVLQEQLSAVIEQFVEDHGEMPVAVVIGVLRIVEHEFIDRL